MDQTFFVSVRYEPQSIPVNVSNLGSTEYQKEWERNAAKTKKAKCRERNATDIQNSNCRERNATENQIVFGRKRKLTESAKENNRASKRSTYEILNGSKKHN